jgi:catechol 2,3-dioxygenase-like lactoylglutathione lyase family enzyme
VYDHVTVRVPDLGAAERRFQSLLDQLAFDETHSTRSIAVWGDFALAQTEEATRVTRRAHVAFAARSREAVDAFWEAGRAAGLAGERPPGSGSHGGYDGEDGYAAVVRDEQDNDFAAVHHAAGGRRDGHVDHVALRVADLGAAVAFYRGVAEAAGLELRHAGEERATLAGRAAGGSLALVPGGATEHLHLAFPGDADAVRRFYATAVEAGHRPNGEPGERARYHPGYFAAYVLDPDGNNIEVVDHQGRGWA